MSCQYCAYAVSARGTVWPSLVCERESGFSGIWRLLDFGGVCENFVPLNEGLLGIHNGLDNRRSNLRICTTSQNSRNRRPDRGKYKGVSFNKHSRRFVASLMYQQRTLTIGDFKDEIAAAKAYDEKTKELFGEYAYLNFPEK